MAGGGACADARRGSVLAPSTGAPPFAGGACGKDKGEQGKHSAQIFVNDLFEIML